MKHFILFIGTVLFGWAANAQSLQTMGLNGKVKCIHEELNICSHKYGKPQTKNCSYLDNNIKFTVDGIVIEQPYEDYEGIRRLKKQIDTGFLVEVFRTEDGVETKSSESYYNDKNLIVKTIYFNDLGEVMLTDTIFYNTQNHKIKSEKLAIVNGVSEKKILFYDDHQKMCAFEMYVNDELKESEKFKTSYTFDALGNWVELIIEDSLTTYLHKRTIEYY
ncbi:hypothetical protein P3875_02780 [Myroides sp. JBRI-B21084]|uniref:hypothetical protein n=1 Tax=Myroides sp. JBRI-B21084 TaxID=3119977 RepID=UPI0026E19008|nr:hypothetical protein [Paenimyroides cloacae]WKW47000.1 hypothetical protein P3875_02780 [Paenimyroides cloacae]